jgi:hypothetical protein
VLGALRPLLAALPNRSAALRWFTKWRPKLDAAGSCPDDDRCPTCRERRPCPLDTWHQPVAAAALGRLDGGQSARSFLHASGVDTGRGVFTTWRDKKLAPLADHAAWLVHQHWMTTGQPNRTEMVGRYAWDAGGRDPRLVAAHARRVATAASAERLTEARNICDEALLHRGSSTDDGWTGLREVRNRTAGQLARRQLRPSGKADRKRPPHPGPPPPRADPSAPVRARPLNFRASGLVWSSAGASIAGAFRSRSGLLGTRVNCSGQVGTTVRMRRPTARSRRPCTEPGQVPPAR